MKRIHITGPPRSGTTLMMELMVSCFKIDSFCKNEISLLVVPPNAKPGTIICTKNPNEWSLVPELLQCDPNQWFIFMARDPRDVVVSRHKFRPDMYWANLRQWRSAWDSIKEYINHKRLIVILYEELVRKPDTVQQAISNKIPFLESKILFSEFHIYSKPSPQFLQALNGLRPISDSSVGKWRNHKTRLAGQLKLHGPITDLLIQFGYETDASWLDELKGVKEDTSPGFWQDFIPQEKRSEKINKLNKLLAEYLRKRGLSSI